METDLSLPGAESMGDFPWTKTDAGRGSSKRPKQVNDCTVRALVLTRGLSYDEAYDVLKAAGRECNKRFLMVAYLSQQPWAHKIAFQAVKGERRMNPVTFTKQFSNGVYICRTAKHVFAVVDGVVLDDHKASPNRCIYTAWKITE